MKYCVVNQNNPPQPVVQPQVTTSDSKWHRIGRILCYVTALFDLAFSIIVLVWAIGKHFRNDKKSVTVSLSVLDLVVMVALLLMLVKGVHARKARWVFPYMVLSLVNVVFWIIFTILYFISESDNENGLGLLWLGVAGAVLYWLVRGVLQASVFYTYGYIKTKEKLRKGVSV